MKRWDIINRISSHLEYHRYLEIGTWMGECISKVGMPIRHGVDPGDKPVKVEDCKGKWSPVARQLQADPRMHFGPGSLQGKDAFFQMTSDEFFVMALKTLASHDRSERLDYDFIFIDGCHTQIQSLVDFINALILLNLGGTIMLHDTLPPHQKNACEDGMDNGEVWKTVAILNCTWPDLEIITVDIDMGCTLISRAPYRTLYREAPLSTCLMWDYMMEHRSELLGVVSVEKFIIEYLA